MDQDFLLDKALSGNRENAKVRACLGVVYGRMLPLVLVLVLAMASVFVFAQVGLLLAEDMLFQIFPVQETPVSK
jgi:hypothetical protein